MSSRKPIAISTHARRDLRSICLSLLQAEEPEQVEAYLEEFDAACERLRAFPSIGVPRGELLPGLRVVIVGSHAVYYRSSADGVRILRILHQHEDHAAEFGRREVLP